MTQFTFFEPVEPVSFTVRPELFFSGLEHDYLIKAIQKKPPKADYGSWNGLPIIAVGPLNGKIVGYGSGGKAIYAESKQAKKLAAIKKQQGMDKVKSTGEWLLQLGFPNKTDTKAVYVTPEAAKVLTAHYGVKGEKVGGAIRFKFLDLFQHVGEPLTPDPDEALAWAAQMAAGEIDADPFPDVKTLKFVEQVKSGQHEVQKFVDPSGKNWFFKYDDIAITHAEEAAARVGRLVMGELIPPSRHVTLNGKPGVLIAEVPGKELNKHHHSSPPMAALEKYAGQVAGHFVVDWLTSQHDGHAGNFMDDGTKLSGIDKGQAWKFFGKDKLDKDYSPNASNTIYNKFWNMVQDGLVDLPEVLKGLGDALANAEKISKAQFKAVVAPYVAIAAGHPSKGFDPDKRSNAMAKRLETLREDMEGFLSNLMGKPITIPKPGPSADNFETMPDAEPEPKEEAKWAAIGAISGGKVKNLEAAGWTVKWAEDVLPTDVVDPDSGVGPLPGAAAKKLQEKGLVVVKPSEPPKVITPPAFATKTAATKWVNQQDEGTILEFVSKTGVQHKWQKQAKGSWMDLTLDTQLPQPGPGIGAILAYNYSPEAQKPAEPKLVIEEPAKPTVIEGGATAPVQAAPVAAGWPQTKGKVTIEHPGNPPANDGVNWPTGYPGPGFTAQVVYKKQKFTVEFGQTGDGSIAVTVYYPDGSSKVWDSPNWASDSMTLYAKGLDLSMNATQKKKAGISLPAKKAFGITAFAEELAKAGPGELPDQAKSVQTLEAEGKVEPEQKELSVKDQLSQIPDGTVVVDLPHAVQEALKANKFDFGTDYPAAIPPGVAVKVTEEGEPVIYMAKQHPVIQGGVVYQAWEWSPTLGLHSGESLITGIDEAHNFDSHAELQALKAAMQKPDPITADEKAGPPPVVDLPETAKVPPDAPKEHKGPLAPGTSVTVSKKFPWGKSEVMLVVTESGKFSAIYMDADKTAHAQDFESIAAASDWIWVNQKGYPDAETYKKAHPEKKGKVPSGGGWKFWGIQTKPKPEPKAKTDLPEGDATPGTPGLASLDEYPPLTHIMDYPVGTTLLWQSGDHSWKAKKTGVNAWDLHIPGKGVKSGVANATLATNEFAQLAQDVKLKLGQTLGEPEKTNVGADAAQALEELDKDQWALKLNKLPVGTEIHIGATDAYVEHTYTKVGQAKWTVAAKEYSPYTDTPGAAAASLVMVTKGNKEAGHPNKVTITQGGKAAVSESKPGEDNWETFDGIPSKKWLLQAPVGAKVKLWNTVGKELNEATKNADGDWDVKTEVGYSYTWDNDDLATMMKPLFKAPFVGTEKGVVSSLVPPDATPGDPLAKLTGGAENPSAPGWMELDDAVMPAQLNEDPPGTKYQWWNPEFDGWETLDKNPNGMWFSTAVEHSVAATVAASVLADGLGEKGIIKKMLPGGTPTAQAPAKPAPEPGKKVTVSGSGKAFWKQELEEMPVGATLTYQYQGEGGPITYQKLDNGLFEMTGPAEPGKEPEVLQDELWEATANLEASGYMDATIQYPGNLDVPAKTAPVEVSGTYPDDWGGNLDNMAIGDQLQFPNGIVVQKNGSNDYVLSSDLIDPTAHSKSTLAMGIGALFPKGSTAQWIKKDWSKEPPEGGAADGKAVGDPGKTLEWSPQPPETELSVSKDQLDMTALGTAPAGVTVKFQMGGGVAMEFLKEAPDKWKGTLHHADGSMANLDTITSSNLNDMMNAGDAAHDFTVFVGQVGDEPAATPSPDNWQTFPESMHQYGIDQLASALEPYPNGTMLKWVDTKGDNWSAFIDEEGTWMMNYPSGTVIPKGPKSMAKMLVGVLAEGTTQIKVPDTVEKVEDLSEYGEDAIKKIVQKAKDGTTISIQKKGAAEATVYQKTGSYWVSPGGMTYGNQEMWEKTADANWNGAKTKLGEAAPVSAKVAAAKPKAAPMKPTKSKEQAEKEQKAAEVKEWASKYPPVTNPDALHVLAHAQDGMFSVYSETMPVWARMDGEDLLLGSTDPEFQKMMQDLMNPKEATPMKAEAVETPLGTFYKVSVKELKDQIPGDAAGTIKGPDGKTYPKGTKFQKKVIKTSKMQALTSDPAIYKIKPHQTDDTKVVVKVSGNGEQQVKTLMETMAKYKVPWEGGPNKLPVVGSGNVLVFADKAELEKVHSQATSVEAKPPPQPKPFSAASIPMLAEAKGYGEVAGPDVLGAVPAMTLPRTGKVIAMGSHGTFRDNHVKVRRVKAADGKVYTEVYGTFAQTKTLSEKKGWEKQPIALQHAANVKSPHTPYGIHNYDPATGLIIEKGDVGLDEPGMVNTTENGSRIEVHRGAESLKNMFRIRIEDGQDFEGELSEALKLAGYKPKDAMAPTDMETWKKWNLVRAAIGPTAWTMEMRAKTEPYNEAWLNEQLQKIPDYQQRLDSMVLKETVPGHPSWIITADVETYRKAGWKFAQRYDQDYQSLYLQIMQGVGWLGQKHKGQAGMMKFGGGGQSAKADIVTGGSDCAFTRGEKHWSSAPGANGVVIHPRAFLRADWRRYYGDAYGNITGKGAQASHLPGAPGRYENLSNEGTETGFQGGVPLADVMCVTVSSETTKQKLMKMLNADGITEVNGVPLADFILVGSHDLPNRIHPSLRPGEEWT